MDGPAFAWRYISLRTNRPAGSIPFLYFYVCPYQFFKFFFLLLTLCYIYIYLFYTPMRLSISVSIYIVAFSVVNLGSLLLISGGYLWMFVAAKMTHRATENLCQHRSLSESAMAWRMSLLVATDAACWVPIIGLGLFSLAGFKVPSQVIMFIPVRVTAVLICFFLADRPYCPT